MPPKAATVIKSALVILAGCLIISCGKQDSDSSSSIAPTASAAPPAPPSQPATVPSISYSSATFNERLSNDGSVEGTMWIDIADDTFAADVVSGVKYDIRNTPGGLTANLQYVSNTTLKLSFTGQASSHLAADSLANVTIEFQNGAFVNTATASSVTQYLYETIAVSYIDSAPSYYLLYSSLEFNEAATNDGSTPGSIIITYNNGGVPDTFTADVTSHVTASNVPGGLTANFTRDSDTQVTLTLTGNAVSHGDSDDISNLTIEFTDDAFTTQPASNVSDATKNLSVYFFDVELAYSGTQFDEAVANNGSIDNTIEITLTGDTYSAGVTTLVDVTNIPAGLAKSVTRNSDTLLTVGLTGNATDHANSNDISNLSITFNVGAFTNAPPSNVTNSSRSDLSIDFDDTFGSLSYSSGVFNESVASDGNIPGFIDITLSGDIFETDAANHVNASNLPVGISALFTRQSDTVMRCQLTGTTANHSDADDISNMSITFTNDAFQDALAVNVTGYNRSDLMIDFFDISLTYSTTEFAETGVNDGATSTSMEITLTNDTFPADVLSYISTNNVPVGMSANLVRNSDTMVTFTLTGNAAAHTNADDVTNLTIDFGDNAFTNANAINVGDSLKTDLSVNFIDVSLAYNGLAFTEPLNDGSVSGSTEITLTGDTFAADVGDHINTSNVPGGLTARFTRNSDTLVTMDFTGQATLHQDSDDVANMSITFLDAAFSNATAATVENSSQAGLTIDFDDNPFLTYSISEFSEDPSNDGSMINSITLDLSGDTFDANVVTNSSILVSNIPTGLTADFTRNSDTQLIFSLTGNANPHEISDSIANLTIEFLEHAFVTTGYAPAVVGYTRNDLQVSFMDPFTVLYSASQLNESDENDGSFTETLVMTLVGETFSANVVSSNLVQAYNLPVGLSAGFTRDSDTQVTMTLSGNTGEHEKSHNVTDVTIAFQDGAFVIKAEAADVTDSTKPDLKLNFYSSIIDISINQHACAILASGEVKCWGGSNSRGQHGRGDTLSNIGQVAGTMGENLGSALLGDGRTAQSIHAGNYLTCARLDTNEVKCWGINIIGMLGLGDIEDRDTVGEMGDNLSVVDLGTCRTVFSLVTAEWNSCAVLDTDEVQCWGGNNWGALGIGNTTERIGDSPSDMGDNLNTIDLGDTDTVISLASVSGNSRHFCAILTNGDLKCWGYNNQGRLGLGDTNDRGDEANEMGNNLPVIDLGTGLSAKKVVVGGQNTCVILNDDSLKCWGDGVYGQLGQGDYYDRGDEVNEMGDNLPVIDLGTDVSGDSHTHTVKEIATALAPCAILDDDRLKCWGMNDYGQVGIGTTAYPKDDVGDDAGEMGDNLGYIDLGTGRTVKKVVSDDRSICAILDNDRLKCWGYNTTGTLGLEDTENRGDNPGEMGDNLPFVDL